MTAPNPGFPSHVQAQLHQAAQQVSSSQNRGGGRGRGQTGASQRGGRTQTQWTNSGNVAHSRQLHSSRQQIPPQDIHSFPPLGSSRPVQPVYSSNVAPQNPQTHTRQPYRPNPQGPVNTQNTAYPHNHTTARQQQPYVQTPQNQPIRSHPNQRGQIPNYGGELNVNTPQSSGGYAFTQTPQSQYSPRGARTQRGSQRGRYQSLNATDNNRADPTRTVQPGRLFNHNASQYHGTADQQRTQRQRIIAQSDYLMKLAQEALVNRIPNSELKEREAFRKELEQLIRNTLIPLRQDLAAEHIKLKCYGSLANGFGLSGCDMDLLLVFAPESQITEQDNFYIDSRRKIEKILLDQGYGARLLTNTRVPILRVCQKPGSELLQNLRTYREEWDESQKEIATEPSEVLLPPNPTDVDVGIVEKLLAEWNADEMPLPESPTTEPVKLEFDSDCGIQCDINFSNFVALHNSRMLRTYSKIDPRVAELGVFVKYWAKIRDINTPYHGTLSSYGYILLVLHYLMNIVDPPILPNLQVLAKSAEWDESNPVELCDGFDIRYLTEGSRLNSIMQSQPRNHESIGQLIRGFFWYFATQDGFHWTQEVLSLRNQGGILTKRAKGWTEAKWAEKSESRNIRLRYLLAIEDPFEIDHNVGRTVGHNGIVAIRDELRRAWTIICKVGSGEDMTNVNFLEPVTDRGDTLKKDHLARKQKIFEMRQQAEAAEKALRERTDVGNNNRGDVITGRSAYANMNMTGSTAANEQNLPLLPQLTTSVPMNQENKSHKKSLTVPQATSLSQTSLDMTASGNQNTQLRQLSPLEERRTNFRPETWAVKFDPQQLKDIAVIVGGGNGCARSGQQYMIEQEYELGGGGLMGWKPSTVAENIRSDDSHTAYEAGQGDKEGFLQHLPGLSE